MPDQFPTTERTRMRRRAKRATYDVETVHAIFDEALIASVAVVIDGQPHVQPMIHARIGTDLILHGLATNRLLNAIATGRSLHQRHDRGRDGGMPADRGPFDAVPLGDRLRPRPDG